MIRLVQTSLMNTRLIAAEPVSAYDAKTHLPKLLERAQRGERFVITRHGKPVALLVPIGPSEDVSVLRAMEQVRTIRSRLASREISTASILGPDETPRQLAHRGHRY